jgi:RNA polymerase sigma-70 factor, ECF subfamily
MRGREVTMAVGLVKARSSLAPCAGNVAMSNSWPAARFPALPLSERKEPADTVHKAVDVSTPEASDESLLLQIAAGDREALAALFQRYVGLTRGLVVRILRDTAEAEDLVQDLFIYLQRRCAIFDSSKSSARSWIIQMAYHRAIERRRYLTARQFYSRENEEAMRDHVVGVPTDESDYSAEAVFGRNGLGNVFESLSEDQRETLRLYFFDGFTLAEIAVKLGQPHANVRHHYYRGLGKLRKQMFGTTVRVIEPHGK